MRLMSLSEIEAYAIRHNITAYPFKEGNEAKFDIGFELFYHTTTGNSRSRTDNYQGLGTVVITHKKTIIIEGIRLTGERSKSRRRFLESLAEQAQKELTKEEIKSNLAINFGKK